MINCTAVQSVCLHNVKILMTWISSMEGFDEATGVNVLM
jgi:hypothetical protein